MNPTAIMAATGQPPFLCRLPPERELTAEEARDHLNADMELTRRVIYADIMQGLRCVCCRGYGHRIDMCATYHLFASDLNSGHHRAMVADPKYRDWHHRYGESCFKLHEVFRAETARLVAEAKRRLIQVWGTNNQHVEPIRP